MRIGLIATVSAPVGSGTTGSVESVIWLLAREYAVAGHEVTVFGCEGSTAPGAEVVTTLPGPYATDSVPSDWYLCEWVTLTEAVRQSNRFDVLHAHAYMWSLPLDPLSACPMVHTTHVMPYDD